MADEQMEAPKETKKGGKLKWIIILVVLLGVLGGAGFFLKDQIMGMLGMGPAKTDQAQQADAGAPPADAQAPQGEPTDTVLVSLPPFVVNLADPLGRRYLKLTVDVEMRDQDAADTLNKNVPKVRDAIILLLSSKTFADLSSIQNKLALKDEIVKRLNQVTGGSSVLRVYFTEMVVQ